MKPALRITASLAALFALALATQAQDVLSRWTRNDAPAESYVVGGPGHWNSPEQPWG